jgi:hypothetical protein
MEKKVTIICIDNSNYPISLEINKTYEALESDFFYIIIDENYDHYEFPKEIFVKV